MSVYQRNGHWYLDVTVNGKRFRKAIKEARTKRQAEKAELVLRDEIFENRYGIGGQKTFVEFVEKSYKPYAAHHKKGYSVELSVIKSLLDEFGSQKLYEITPEQIEGFKRRRATEITRFGAVRSRATVNRDIAVLSAIFNLAKSYGELKENPVSRVTYYGNLNSRTRVLSEIEERKLFKTIADDEPLKQKITILLYTGMRRGELFKLEWRDVDLKKGSITIRAEITKTGKGRIIPMLSNVSKVFKAILVERPNVVDEDRIFLGQQSTPWMLSQSFRKICDSLGWKDLKLHSLRHTFSTRADQYGVGPFAHKELLGHSKLTMTDRYTHVSEETLRHSLGRFEQYLPRE
jgi:integrase